MGRKSRFVTSPFPNLILSEAEVDHIREIAHQLIGNCVTDYENYLHDGRRINMQQWQFVKQKHDLRAFLEIQQEKDSETIPIMDHSRSNREALHSTAHTKIDVPAVLCTGIIVGDLDDYIDLPLWKTKLVKNRDFVYLEATGTTTLQTGERVGYNLIHSIHFPRTCELEGRIRGNLSVCSIFRQVHQSTMEVYAMDVSLPGGELPKLLWTQLSIDPMLSVTHFVHCGQMRKLAWKLQKAIAAANEKKHPMLPPPESPIDARCIACERQTQRWFFVDRRKFSRECSICDHLACRSCTIKVKMSFMTHANELMRKKVAFCRKCVSEAVTSSAVDAVRGQLVSHEDTTYTSMYSDVSSKIFSNRTLRLA